MRWSRFYSYLLSVVFEKVKSLKHSDIRQNYERNAFVGPCSTNARALFNVDSVILETLPDEFEFLDFSPLAPIGACSTLSKISQKTVLSTIKDVEVLADITILLALESANKWADSVSPLCYATSGRMVRMQKFSPESNLTQHFRGFALSSTQKNSDSRIIFDMIGNHILTWLKILNALNSSGKYLLKNIKVSISNTQIMEKVIQRLNIDRDVFSKSIRTEEKPTFKNLGINLPAIINPEEVDSISSKIIDIADELRLFQSYSQKIKELANIYPDILFQYHLERSAGLGYHSGLCFKISAENMNGNRYSLIDGGAKDWIKGLLNNQKMIFCSSGFGSEMFAKLYTT